MVESLCRAMDILTVGWGRTPFVTFIRGFITTSKPANRFRALELSNLYLAVVISSTNGPVWHLPPYGWSELIGCYNARTFPFQST